MATRLFYQDKKLHSLINGGVTSSLFRTAGTAHAEHKATTQGVETSILATNETGSVVQTHTSHGQDQLLSYSAYGAIQTELTKAQTLLFNGEWREPLTGCYPLGNGYRLFSPKLMRFHSPDDRSPFGSGGLNTYAYCEGDPVNYTDPQGHGKLKTLPGRAARDEASGFNSINPNSRTITRDQAQRQPRAPSPAAAQPVPRDPAQPSSAPVGRTIQENLQLRLQREQPSWMNTISRTARQAEDEALFFMDILSDFSDNPAVVEKIITHVFALTRATRNLQATKLLNISAGSTLYNRLQRLSAKSGARPGLLVFNEMFEIRGGH
ncbi:RHS repeat-associated core domain-containing protein [Pseudomonas xanthosomatis]|uniref:RHS repeat-associated core domain-containing protein n=1 Tax=Pseudomonas xanthosomatis TaxID=2842356 RepID=UPI001C3CE759|nr:RHS repeat-associated core domain-containing protein [Pseudomonas xanthosomatis]QXH46560.1 RHS repeat-associated core domain-containing protein [Pseudomonas xanthosomatis]